MRKELHIRIFDEAGVKPGSDERDGKVALSKEVGIVSAMVVVVDPWLTCDLRENGRSSDEVSSVFLVR